MSRLKVSLQLTGEGNFITNRHKALALLMNEAVQCHTWQKKWKKMAINHHFHTVILHSAVAPAGP